MFKHVFNQEVRVLGDLRTFVRQFITRCRTKYEIMFFALRYTNEFVRKSQELFREKISRVRRKITQTET